MELKDKIAQWYQVANKPGSAAAEGSREPAHKEFLNAFAGLEGKTLDVYYKDIVRQGAKKAWSVDLYNDDINRQCGLSWTWTIVTRKVVEGSGIAPLPWLIVVGNCSFSIPILESVLNEWAKEKGCRFNVKVKKAQNR